MPTAVQFIETEKPKKSRIYVILGEDAALRADVLDRVVAHVAPQDRVTLHVGSAEGDATAAQVWDAVTTRPLAGTASRLVVVHAADRLRHWAPLKVFVDNASIFPETTLVLVLNRPQLGTRQRVRKPSMPGGWSWEDVLAEWEQWLKSYTSSSLITCRPLSIEPNERGKLAPATRWLSARLPVTQRQAEYLWRRVGGDSILARDTVRALRALGLADASGLQGSQFASYVDAVVGIHGPEDLVDQLLFERRADAFAAVAEQDFSRADWAKILGLLGQRLDWLGPLHEALATNEQLDQVMRRLGIHRKWILYYAHREDKNHNVARRYDPKKVARCRRLIADFDAQLNSSRGVPSGFGEALVSAW